MDEDALIVEIGKSIVLDERYQAQDWTAIALVGDFSDGREAMHGVVYQADGTWQGEVPEDPEDVILDTMLELKRVMTEKRQDTWHQCLIQLNRETEEVKVKFEYNNPSRWSMTPDNAKALIEEIKPS